MCYSQTLLLNNESHSTKSTCNINCPWSKTMTLGNNKVLQNIWKLQLVQNIVAWIINGASYMTYLTLLLCQLHWLLLCFKVQFKVVVITFKALQGVGLCYLKDCLFLKDSIRPIQLDWPHCRSII